MQLMQALLDYGVIDIKSCLAYVLEVFLFVNYLFFLFIPPFQDVVYLDIQLQIASLHLTR